MNYKYKISVIIPIYNSEEYIEQTIKSIINQNIGFKESIQLILINDGSKDNSEKICLKYQKKYPDNIVYRYKENGGVSDTRNFGLQFVQGKYVNFFDSDDIWDKNAFNVAINLLEENNDINLASCKVKFFDAKKGAHVLNYKFENGTHIVDIFKEPQNIQTVIASIIFRYESIKDKKFDTRLKYAEDAKFSNEIILEDGKYIAISDAIYYYRKRKNRSSASQNSKLDISWYTDTLKFCQDYLINKSKEKYGRIIEYVKYYIMYDMQWRIAAHVPANINDKIKEEYVYKLEQYLKEINDEIITFQKNMSSYNKLLAIKVKYGEKFEDVLQLKDDGIYVYDNLIMAYDKLINNIIISNIVKNKLIIDGNIFLNEIPFKLYYKINNNQRYEIKTFNMENSSNIFKEKVKLLSKGYNVEIDLNKVKNIKFEIEINGKFYILKNNYTKYSRINNFKAGYYYENEYLMIKNKEKTELLVAYKPSKIKLFLRELYFLAYIIFSRKQIKVGILRIIYYLTKPFMCNNIWLFADREFMAKDSAEVVFRYTNKQENKNKRKTYFTVEKSSKDFKRMKQYGKVVGYHTLRYKLLFLNAKYLISSHADEYVNNEFGGSRKYYIDIYKFKYIYLTHGVLLHDSSAWLNRINKNIELNVVTSPMEYESIINGKYYFKPNQLMKTGLPRHDNLFNENVKEENKILIMASWRSKLAGAVIKSTQKRVYNPDFINSEYCNFYNKLLNDDRLIKVLREYGYKVKFCIHPSFRAQKKDFKGNDFVEIATDVDSQYETLTSKMLITDYSSAACDFAYLRKPVIYANFDLDHIYDIHYYNKGYFDYDKNGYGPNCKDYDETLKQIINTIKNNCIMEEKYIKRCDEFFYYNDNNNAKRVYEELIKHESELN